MGNISLERPMMLLSIVRRGKGKKLMNVLNKNEIRLHVQTMGFGTAPLEMMDIMAPDNITADIMETVNTNFGLRSPARGIMCSVPIEKAYKI